MQQNTVIFKMKTVNFHIRTTAEINPKLDRKLLELVRGSELILDPVYTVPDKFYPHKICSNVVCFV